MKHNVTVLLAAQSWEIRYNAYMTMPWALVCMVLAQMKKAEMANK